MALLVWILGAVGLLMLAVAAIGALAMAFRPAQPNRRKPDDPYPRDFG
jgi:hypothetical protein